MRYLRSLSGNSGVLRACVPNCTTQGSPWSLKNPALGAQATRSQTPGLPKWVNGSTMSRESSLTEATQRLPSPVLSVEPVIQGLSPIPSAPFLIK